MWSLLMKPVRESLQTEMQWTADLHGRAGASVDVCDYKAVNWAKVHRDIKRLQRRIIKAVQEGRTGKVRALCRILTRSWPAKLMAVKRVTSNKGSRTPGVDNILWRSAKDRWQAAKSLTRRNYKPKPLRRIYLVKKNGKLRPLGIPCMIDRAMQALHKLALEPIAECHADPNSYGFRILRSTHDAIEQLVICLSRKDSCCWILEGDIKACFDQINHQWLLDNVPMDRLVLRSWLQAGYMEKGQLFPTQAGTPQGGIISPILANFALDGLERAIKSLFPKKTKIHVVRYADDFVVVAESEMILQQQVKPVIERFLQERGLVLSPEKTLITHIRKGFDFLGKNIRKFGDKLLVQPSKEAVKSFTTKARDLIRGMRGQAAKQLIIKFNQIARGWSSYHRLGSSNRAFNHVDYQVRQALERWIRRGRKRGRWGHWWRKYFSPVPGSFSSWVKVADGTKRLISTLRLGSVALGRQIKIKGAANPFDPVWDDYFAARKKRGSRVYKPSKSISSQLILSGIAG